MPLPSSLRGIAFLGILTVLGAAQPARAADDRRPNVVLVLTDDQGYGELGCHGNTVVQTPHLDKLHAGCAACHRVFRTNA
jgi:hypothetical protein